MRSPRSGPPTGAGPEAVAHAFAKVPSRPASSAQSLLLARPSLGRLQFAAAVGAMGRTAASAPPPHDGACHDKYHWENPGQEDDEPPDRPAVAALVDPAHPLRGAIAGQRARQPFNGTATIIDHDVSDLTAPSVAQLHAPDRTDVPRALALTLRFSTSHASALVGVRTRGWQENDLRACARLRGQRGGKRGIRRQPRIGCNRTEARPLTLRGHCHDRGHELACGLREAQINASERHHCERNRDPEPEQVMEVCCRLRGAAPAQARQERTIAGPPQPNAGEREGQHADAHPADDGAAGIFRNRQVLMKTMEPADKRRAKIHYLESTCGGRIEIDIHDPRRSVFGVRRAARHDDHRPAFLQGKSDGNRLRARFKRGGGRLRDKPRARQGARRLRHSGWDGSVRRGGRATPTVRPTPRLAPAGQQARCRSSGEWATRSLAVVVPNWTSNPLTKPAIRRCGSHNDLVDSRSLQVITVLINIFVRRSWF